MSTAEQIPAVGFHPRNANIDGIELLSLDRIINHNDQFDHHPEKPHQLNFYNITYFTGGESEHLIDFERYPVKPGSIVYLSKGQVNAFSFAKDTQGYCLVFTQKYLEDNFSHLSQGVLSQVFNHQLYEPVIQVAEEVVFLPYMELLSKELKRTHSSEKTFVVSSLFALLLAKVQAMRTGKALTATDSQKVQLVTQFSDLVQEAYHKSRNADYYAQKLLITYKHLNLCCKEVLNKTAKQVINEYVILEAKRRLINSAVQSSEIGYQLGFEEPTNFTKYFKKLTGMTPIQFKAAEGN